MPTIAPLPDFAYFGSFCTFTHFDAGVFASFKNSDGWKPIGYLVNTVLANLHCVVSLAFSSTVP